MSTLHVENLKGLTSGGNANKIIVPSGQTIDASAGTLLPSEGQIVQVVKMTPTGSSFASTSNSFAKTNLALSITPKYSNSLIKFEACASFLNTGAEMNLHFYKDGVASNLLPDTAIHGDYDNNGAYSTYTLMFYHSPNTTSSVEYAVYANRNGSSGAVYVYRGQYVTLTEIKQ